MLADKNQPSILRWVGYFPGAVGWPVSVAVTAAVVAVAVSASFAVVAFEEPRPCFDDRVVVHAAALRTPNGP